MAVKKKVPMRKCVGCGEMKPKKELIRILRTEEEEFVIDRKTDVERISVRRRHVLSRL